ncbi:helicase [Nocardia flavorosea]|uniref:helicase-related protein n=1 Tax=Nocardia flavorosea TaxID=53429 RepID=UPI00189635F4|nr:helicase-related protein [Nocardia flavorosea]MBF6348998.1 helicase [Nocardia flavorosea]
MTLTNGQKVALDHLRAAYVGPEHGEDEVLQNRPNLQYSIGMLFPVESKPPPSEVTDEGAVLSSAVPTGDVEEDGAGVPLPEDWRPSSIAISFVTDSDTAVCDFSGGTYEAISDDGPPRWRRRPFEVLDVAVSADRPPQRFTAGHVPFEIGSRWRRYGDAHLVTVHVRLTEASTGNDKLDIDRMLFQVDLAVRAADGAKFIEYDTYRTLDLDEESAELRLRYRNRTVYAVGHGMATGWESESGHCTKIFLTPLPSFIVPSVETTGFDADTEEARALRLDVLSRIDSDPDAVLRLLDAFVAAFSTWVAVQESRVETFGDQTKAARDITSRSRVAADRMAAGVELLRKSDQPALREAFALAMAAMRLQMQQAAVNRGNTGGEPAWRPFQLGFLLVSLASTVEEEHPDRALVDLIWFPTGGGKTEAYLGLAAIEIFRRRLLYGMKGAGTAVITRYTLRLLTAQQFQRAAALICAMEILRGSDPRVKGMARFTIGLWVGNEATPATRPDAKAALERLLKATRPEEANKFQVESCPWCLTPLIPRQRSDDPGRYGMKLVGRDIIIHCTDRNCHFAAELPLAVVDDLLYDEPPTILLATVDKFARLQFKPEAGKLLGLDTSYRQPSMVIQDELHLLSGPLGTTVAVFDAVIQLLLSKTGTRPKIVASTATIRASQEQIKGLYGRDVALYPPAGLDDDTTFFSRPVENGAGRLYVGLMPQSLPQVTALVAAAAPLAELPAVVDAQLSPPTSHDAYWTLVMYHNSLRELGRTGTLVVDDVNGRLETRAERIGIPLRRIRKDKVLELTSRRRPEELPNDLRELRTSADDSKEAIDVVLSSNMLSVGIDIPRLALMLMVGQPKTTAEYIQATSRVGRGENSGIVVTLFRSNRARDRSHFETFRGYHDALYRSVEPTSVTPWSLSSRQRSLAGALVALIRHSFPSLAADTSAGALDLEHSRLAEAIDKQVNRFLELVSRSDAIEKDETEDELRRLLRDWDRRAAEAREQNKPLRYDRRSGTDESLLKRFGQPNEGWLVADSMRSVEPNVAVSVQEPREEVIRGENQA